MSQSSSDTFQSFPIPLDEPPQIIQAAWGTHGQDKGPSIERYRLPDLWCLHFYGYEAQLKINLREWELAEGCVTLVPPDTRLEYRFNALSTHLYVHFALRRQTRSANEPQIRSWFDRQELPADFGARLGGVAQASTLAQRMNSSSNTTRAQVAVWELLWRLVELSPQGSSYIPAHPALDKASAWVEEHLALKINVSILAREVGVSHNHLTRLFLLHTGRTVVGYIRHRRAERARHLLHNSTLSISSIAAQVGTPNLGQFNHLMRRETGLSPRALRETEHPSNG
jgi:AraC-like DNA-binding protein